jgi:hypothetical protein
MSELTARIESVLAAVDNTRRQLSASDYQKANQLRLIGELAEIVRDLAGGVKTQPDDDTARDNKQQTREATVEHLLMLAVRSLPDQVRATEARDGEVCRVLKAWGVQPDELARRGYQV